MTTETVALNHYTQGPPDAPAVLLVGSLGTTLAMWDGLADALSRRYHVVRVDIRGHGSSPAPPGPYSMSVLAADVVAVADELELDRFACVGLSLGGAIGLTLAVEHPDRLSALAACCTAAKLADRETWVERAARVRAEGTQWLVPLNRDRWFTDTFQQEHPSMVEDVLDMVANTSPVGYSACCDALAEYDLTDRVGEIRTPTLVVAGDHDPVTPLAVTTALAEAIPGAELEVIMDAAHIANLAQPAAFAQAVGGHLDRALAAP